MEIEYLREYVVVSDLLNFSKAARQLYTTQPALSKHVAKMEDELGCKLLERDSHGVSLTDEGRLFLEYARAIANKYDEALENLDSMAQSARRTVTVGYLAGTFGLFMPRIKASAEGKDDSLVVKPRSLGVDGLKQQLVEGKADVILTYDISPELGALCDKVRLSESRVYLIVPQGGPLSGRQWVDAEELQGLDFLLPDPREWPIVAGFFASVMPGYSELRSVGTYSDIDTLIYSIRTGGCVGFSCGRHASFEPLVEYVPVRGVDTRFDIGALWLKDNDKPQVRRFAGCLERDRDEWLAEQLSGF